MGQNLERKLAAIMFTDIVGFTALSAKDENVALKLLDTQKAIVLPIINEFKGTVHKEMGDGLLITFPAVTNAANCGIKIQETIKDIENLNLRIGIHEGEVTFKDGDVLGDDVNVASRIEPFAPIGGIAISGKVQQNISSLKNFKTKFIEQPKLKGVVQEVKIFCITSHGLPETKTKHISVKLEKKQKNILLRVSILICIVLLSVPLFLLLKNKDSKDKTPSIAILPLENKGASDEDFYAYGISADLISDATSAGDLKVASLKDIEKLDYKNLNNDEIANNLLVRYIAQGTLWKKDSIFQLMMEVYDTDEDKVKWLDNWSREWTELPLIKGELSKKILSSINIESTQNLNREVTNNVEAYEYYLRAKTLKDEAINIEDNLLAEELVNKSISIEPNLVEAKLLLARIYFETIWAKTKKYTGFHLKFDSKDSILYQNQIELLNNSSDIAISQNNMKLAGIAKRYLGNAVYQFGGLDSSEVVVKHWDEALEIAKQINDKQAQMDCLSNLGTLYTTTDFEKANKLLLEVLKISKSIDDINTIGRTYDKLARLHRSKHIPKNSLRLMLKEQEHNLIKAIEYFKKAKEYNQGKDYVSTMQSIGYTYNNFSNQLKSENYYNKALEAANKINYSQGIYFAIGGLAEINFSKGNFNKALKQYKSQYLTSKQLNDKLSMVFQLEDIGKTYYALKDYGNALKYLNESMVLKSTIDTKESIYNIGNDIYYYAVLQTQGNKINKGHIKDMYKKHLKENKIENKDFVFPLFNYLMYKLLGESDYLESAQNHITEVSKLLDNKEKNNYSNLYFNKMISNEYNKVFK